MILLNRTWHQALPQELLVTMQHIKAILSGVCPFNLFALRYSHLYSVSLN